MISNLISGIDILLTYNSDAPIVTHAYMTMVPKILQAAMSGPDQTAIEALGWVLHPVYLCYYYPVETITEVANITGAGDADLPPLPIPIP